MKASLLRFLRVGISVVIAGIAEVYGDNQAYLLLAPLISAIGKYLRDKYGLTNLII